MKVLYHIGDKVDINTVVKKGNIDEKVFPLKLEGEDEIVFDDLCQVELSRLDVGHYITLINGDVQVFLFVPRIYLNIGGGFAVINLAKTIKLKKIFERIVKVEETK